MRVEPRRVYRRHSLVWALAAGLLVVLAFSAGCLAADSAANVIRKVDVIVSVEGIAPDAVIVTRLENTLRSVSEKALLGRRVDLGTAGLGGLVATAIREVLSRVLLGYNVQDVQVTVGEESRVRLVVAPDGVVIKDAFVKVQVDGVDPGLADLVGEQVDLLTAEAKRLLSGLPTAAFEWGRLVLEPVMEHRLEELLPGFTVGLRMDLDEAAIVTIHLTPQEPRVTNVSVKLVSDTIPVWLLRDMQSELASRAKLLRGLPVGFLKRYQTRIQQEVDRRINSAEAVQRFSLSVRSQLVAGENSQLRLQVQSDRLRLRTEAVVSIGEEVPGPQIRMRAGVGVGGSEVFLSDELTLTGLASRWEAGVGLPIGFGGELTWQHALSGPDERVTLTKRIGPDRRVRLASELGTGRWEAAYGFSADEHLTAEIGVTQGRWWAALIGNL